MMRFLAGAAASLLFVAFIGLTNAGFVVPGPAGGPFVYGHVWVVLGPLACHPTWGVVALPLLARLYVRAKDLANVPAVAH